MIDIVVKETWSRIMERLQDEIGEKFFKMWFKRCRVISLKRGVLAVGFPNLFIREWVEEHYGAILARVTEEVMGSQVRIAIKVDPDLFREMRRETERMEEVVDTGAESGEGKTLEGFLVTPGHEQAVKALRHVTKGKKPQMNPLLIVGGEGTGKTHLASAVMRLYPEGVTFYRMCGEDFVRRFTWNLKTRRIAQFRDQVTGADVVILDDAQDLAGKPATQREISSLIQSLVARGHQCIVFINQPVQDVPDMDHGFRSVLLSGMLVEMTPPGPEDTVEILQRVLHSGRRRIPRAVIRLVTERVGGSVKRLDRLIRKIYAFSGLTGEPVDEGFLDRHLDEIAGPSDPAQRRFETILSVVEDHFALDRAELLSKRKTKSLSIPRGVVVFLLREQGGLTFKQVGRCLGDRSHTSVYLMYKKYEERIRSDPELSALVKEAGRRLITAG